MIILDRVVLSTSWRKMWFAVIIIIAIIIIMMIIFFLDIKKKKPATTKSHYNRKKIKWIGENNSMFCGSRILLNNEIDCSEIPNLISFIVFGIFFFFFYVPFL